MSDYKIRFTRKRLWRNFLEKTDVCELCGPVTKHFHDSIHGSDTRTSIETLETFLDEDEAYNTMEKYKQNED